MGEPKGVIRFDLPNLFEGKTRHGKPRLRVRVEVNGIIRTAAIKGAPGTPEFYKAYIETLERLKGGERAAAAPALKAPVPDTLGWLAAQYFASPDKFLKLDTTQQRVRRNIIEGCLREPIQPGSKHLMRDCPYLRVDATHLIMLRDRKAATPGAANNRLKYLSAMFSWAIEQKIYKLGVNPCRGVKKIKYATEGFYTWTVEDVAKYVERHPVGTQANLAFALMLFLGARRGDAVQLGPKHMANGMMTYVPAKTTYRSVEPTVKPILRPLAEAIRRTPIGLKTFIVTSFGQPFSKEGFGNKMRDWCDEAGLPECSSHGLKKAAATICANMGATDRQMMALFNWKSEKLANVYTAKANKKKLAAECAKLLGAFFVSPAEDQNAVG